MHTDELLQLWRQTHHPEVLSALDLVSAEVLRQAVPLEGRSDRQVFERWLERARSRDSADVPLLLQTVFDGPTTQVSKRLEALATFEEDPRIGTAAAESLVEWDDSAYDAGEVRVVARLFDVLAVHGFADVLDLTQTYELPKFSTQWPRLKAAFDAKPVRPLTPAQRAALNQVKPSTSAAARLSAATSADARAVAIDALLEAGGPRAEFITLQQTRRQRVLTPKERAREEALRKKYARTWLGRLSKVMNHEDAVFTDGLVSAGWVWANARELASVREAPEWSSLRRLEFHTELDLSLLRRWPTITEVELTGQAASIEALSALANASPPLFVTTLSPASLLHSKVGGVKALGAAPGLPALECVELSSEYGFPFDEFKSLLRGPLGKRLKTIVFRGGDTFHLEALLQLLEQAPRTLQRAQLGRLYGGWRVDLERPFTHATVSFSPAKHQPRIVFEQFLEHLRALPRGVVKTWSAGTIEAPGAPLEQRLRQVLNRG